MAFLDPSSVRARLPDRRFPWGKAALLEWLSPLLTQATVPPLLRFDTRRWQAASQDVLATIAQGFPAGTSFAVRSDAHGEDGEDESHAGRFESVLDVAPGRLAPAIGHVVAGLRGHALDGFFVQEMVAGVWMAGVASTHRPSDGAPWYCVEMAPRDTAAVTAGRANGRLLGLYREAAAPGGSVWERLPPETRRVMQLVLEIERLLPGHPLELEFALSRGTGGELAAHLLQVRRLAAAARWPATRAAEPPALDDLHRADPLPGIGAPRTVLSLMADWNPAELLGTHPRPLALSLFERLIGRGIWWQAREELGYAPRPVADVALLRAVAGRPMVDVRRSAASLLPSGLPPAAAAPIAGHWLDRLQRQPELHDKVEFEVMRTARDFRPATDVRAEYAFLAPAQLHDWETALGHLTARLMQAGNPVVQRHLATVETLAREDLAGATWQQLLRRCESGTLAFAVLARVAFVGEAQLRSAIARGALGPERALALRGAARQAAAGWPQLAGLHSALPDTRHLRPGTFDITGNTWREGGIAAAAPSQEPTDFVLSATEDSQLAALLREAALPATPDAWVRFVQLGTATRELAKFVFTRHLSAALLALEQAAAQCGVDREMASWLSLDAFDAGQALEPAARARYWMQQVRSASHRHAQEALLMVAPLLAHPDDRFMADTRGVLPNFVGFERAQGPVRVLTAHSRPAPDLRSAIVALHGADPGFDWIFGEGIAGLVTAWGGANSHMAIRCAELGLPAAIGCGEAVFAGVLRARRAYIDPRSGGLWLD